MQQEFDGPTEHIYKTVSVPLLAAIPDAFSHRPPSRSLIDICSEYARMERTAFI